MNHFRHRHFRAPASLKKPDEQGTLSHRTLFIGNFWALGFGFLCMMLPGLARAGGGEKLDFTRDVRPIFSENCFHCHGFDAKARKAGLRLDEEAGARKFIKSGDADNSELIRRMESGDPDERMPPPDSHRVLTRNQIAVVRRWIQEGAAWGGHWSFQRVPRGPSRESFAGRNPIDFFVEKKLAAAGIRPNPPASPHTLIRRASLDLTGLPPAPEAVAAFVRDSSPDAWAKVVDRLLASPHYGERMAWEWLDAARYADTNGYQGDRERTMWPWRDWVVSAYNQNLPYDQFTIWQLAGDLLPGRTDEQILATGFCRNHMINGEGGRIAEENRIDYVFDMAETTATVWLGLTMNCCRCHDHKFDPLTQKDYYSLTAFFNQTPVTGGGGDPRTKPVLEVATAAQRARETELESARRAAQKEVDDYAKSIAPGQEKWEKSVSTETVWTPLIPKEASAGKVTLSLLPDHSVLATGANPVNETHTVRFGDAGKITAIRLEALPHESFTNPGKGLARSDSGNFVLTEIEIQAGGKAVKIASAHASFEQGGFPVNKAFDGDARSGWAIHRGGLVSEPHWAVFKLESPASGPLQVTLRHDSVHPHHFLGRFRLLATDSPAPKSGKESEPLLAALRVAPDRRNAEQKKAVEESYRNSDPRFRELEAKARQWKEQLDQHRETIPKVMVMEDMPQPRKTYVLNQGLYDAPREEVAAAIPAVFGRLDAGAPPNRLALARWLASRDHPLMARVTVNRLWEMIFGAGLVKTVEDFGVQSEYPVHPELLDWLAAELMDSGWDLKKLLRVILLSDTYRRNSEMASPDVYENDPDNRLLARGSRFRMPAWMIRDQALEVSGLRNGAIGGPGFNGYQPPGIWEEATFGNKKYVQATGNDLHRRSLYVFWRRIIGPTLFFTSGKRQVCEVKKFRTNTPMHALATLNDVTYVEAARHLAQKALREGGSGETDQVRYIGRRLLAREPGPEEAAIWKRALQRGRDAYATDPGAAAALLRAGDSPRDETLAGAELAAWTGMCLMLLNLDETLNRE